jgi:uncharacterized membrane protein YuzA (DUF378 family)
MSNLDLTRNSTASAAHALSATDWVALALMVIGGLDWGLIGAFGFDPIATLFGEHSIASRSAYVLVGLSSIYALYSATKLAKTD